MPRAIFTPENYEAIKAAYRTAPGNHSHASRASGFDIGACRRAWSKGWTKYSWAPPISKALEEENDRIAAEQIRMQREAAAQAEERRLRMKKDAEDFAIKAAAADGIAIRNMVATGSNGLAVLGPSITAAVEYSKQLADKVKQALHDAKTPGEALDILDKLARVGRTFAMITARGVEAQRLKDDKPTAILGIQSTVELTLEEAVEELSMLNTTIERARARGLLPQDTKTITVEVVEPAAVNGANGHKAS